MMVSMRTPRARPLSPIYCRSRSRSRFPIANDRSARQLGAVTITPAIISQLPLPGIDAVIFYKHDEITTDLICCDVQVAGQVWTFHEEVIGWSNLVTHLSALPGFRADWYEAVASSPFATSETIAFERR
jgi:hypothetical protein